jgi:hypothetical protein
MAGALVVLCALHRATCGTERPHPLVPALELARATQAYVTQNVSDFKCMTASSRATSSCK